jgi:hypothetical protein
MLLRVDVFTNAYNKKYRGFRLNRSDAIRMLLGYALDRGRHILGDS